MHGVKAGEGIPYRREHRAGGGAMEWRTSLTSLEAEQGLIRMDGRHVNNESCSVPSSGSQFIRTESLKAAGAQTLAANEIAYRD
jgi:hypothetical protein